MFQNRAKDALLVAAFNAALVFIDIIRHLELWVTVMNAITVVAGVVMYFVFKRMKPLRTWEDERSDVLLLIDREYKTAFNGDAARGMLTIKLLVKTGSHAKDKP